MKMAQTSAFLDSHAAKFRDKWGELRLLNIWQHKDKTCPLFLPKLLAIFDHFTNQMWDSEFNDKEYNKFY